MACPARFEEAAALSLQRPAAPSGLRFLAESVVREDASCGAFTLWKRGSAVGSPDELAAKMREKLEAAAARSAAPPASHLTSPP